MNQSIINRWLALLLIGLSAGATVRAQIVTINYNASRLYNNSGVALPAGSLVLLVADTAQNGFGTLQADRSLSLGSFLNGDDQILGRSSILSGPIGLTFGAAEEIPLEADAYTSLSTGDHLALIWFSLLTPSSSSLSVGDTYGIYSSATLDDGGYTWAIPSSGLTIELAFKTIAAGGTHPETEAYANLTVTAVPEPATCAALAGLGMLGLTFWRRRKLAR